MRRAAPHLCRKAFFFHWRRDTIHGHSANLDCVPPTIRRFRDPIRRRPQILLTVELAFRAPDAGALVVAVLVTGLLVVVVLVVVLVGASVLGLVVVGFGVVVLVVVVVVVVVVVLVVVETVVGAGDFAVVVLVVW